MFTAALWIIAKTWTQPRYPLVGEWINCGTSRWWNIILSEKKQAIKAWKDMKETEIRITKANKPI